MKNIDIETIFILIYILVDDWYQENSHKILKGKRGSKPIFTDSEIITLT